MALLEHYQGLSIGLSKDYGGGQGWSDNVLSFLFCERFIVQLNYTYYDFVKAVNVLLFK